MKEDMTKARNVFIRITPPTGDDPRKGPGISTLRDVSDKELGIIRKDKKILNEYFNSAKLINSVSLNIYDFCEAVVAYADDFLKKRVKLSHGKIDEISVDLGRLILNILSIFRSFLDHTSYALGHIFGKKSSQMKRWKEKLADVYDSSFEYRFFYHLRNFAQHVGVPPLHISYSESIDTSGITFSLNFIRDSLLANPSNWKSQIRKELKDKNTIFPVIDCLNNWSNDFNVISSEVLDIMSERSLMAANDILKYRDEFDLNDGDRFGTAKFPNKKWDGKSELKIEISEFPEAQASVVI